MQIETSRSQPSAQYDFINGRGAALRWDKIHFKMEIPKSFFLFDKNGVLERQSHISGTVQKMMSQLVRHSSLHLTTSQLSLASTKCGKFTAFHEENIYCYNGSLNVYDIAG